MHYSKANKGYYTEDGKLIISDRDIAAGASLDEALRISQEFQELGLTFNELKTKSIERNHETYNDALLHASLSYFGNALAGEVGETCNLIKKIERAKLIGKFTDVVPASEVGKELADVVIYADLLATKLGLSLGECVKQKFNEVSERFGSKVKFDD